jgi:hypothetical protein
MDVKETGWEGVDWICVAQNGDNWRALENTEINFRIPQNTVNF